MKRTDYEPEVDPNIEAIRRRWKDFSPTDITLYKDLPNWQIIVEDIYYLLTAQDETEKDVTKAYNAGYQDGHDVQLEREYEIGYEDGLIAGRKGSEE